MKKFFHQLLQKPVLRVTFALFIG